MTWQRLEERHSARARSRRGAIVVALVVVLAVGVVAGATAITGSPWLDHVMHFIHMHLKMIHDLFDGSHR